jgi:1-acyl-sn-glycerol-3-phosphate acyltransferase
MNIRHTLETLITLPKIPARLAGMLVTTGVGAPVFKAQEHLQGLTYEQRRWWVMWWSRSILDSLGIEVIDDMPKPRIGEVPEGGRMVVSNHRSMLDILVLLSRFGGHMLSREDLSHWPLIGWLAGFSETLYVDRSSPISGAASIRTVSDRLSDRHTVTVFAEGTTYPDDELRPFQPGAFVAITRSGGEVLPVGLAYNDPNAIFFQEPFGAHARKVLLARKIRVVLSAGRPFAVERRTARALESMTHERVQALIRRARSLV